jgi:cell division initiation protein
MKITPLEIRQKTFTKKTIGGIDKEEVNAYLVTLSMAWEQTLEENKELRIRLESSEKEASKLREIENSLFLTLKTAEETSTTLTDQAAREADLMMKEAKIKSEAIVLDAEWKAKTTIEDAEEEARKTFKTLQHEIKELEMEYRNIEHLRDNTLNDLKNLANDINEKIERVNNREAESLLSSGKASKQENVRQANQARNQPKAVNVPSTPVELPIAEAPHIPAAKPVETPSPILAPSKEKSDDKGSFFDQFN